MRDDPPATPRWCIVVVVAATLIAAGLMVDQAWRSSAVYDETAYLRVATRWWRTGVATEISRMGSPVTFLKLQQAPTLWLLDRLGHADWVDDPVRFQPQLLPWVRLGSIWIGLVALGVAAGWARLLHGPRAMALAAVLFALSPNLLAHGALATMETPLVAASSAAFAAFWWYLRTGRRGAWLVAAVMAGLAFSVKFTAVLLPPILAAAWWVDLRLAPDRPGVWRCIIRIGLGMLGLAAVMVLTDLVVTGFRVIPASTHGGGHPAFARALPGPAARWATTLAERSWPQDWVAFLIQTAHQRRGGPSYLFGQTRSTGWWSYYFVALAVKAPLALGWLVAARVFSRSDRARSIANRGWYPLLIVVLFLALAAAGSKRNYGVRYLLPAAVPAIVWISALAERGVWARRSGWIGAAGMALAIGLIHPHELSFFNRAAGGPIGGRRILSDSNLDWGQGLRDLARLQRDRPELRDLTLFYFGDIDPAVYGIAGTSYTFDANRPPPGLPRTLRVETTYLAVSASLRWGPWGPPGYFDPLRGEAPILDTADATIAVYRARPGGLRGTPGAATMGPNP